MPRAASPQMPARFTAGRSEAHLRRYPWVTIFRGGFAGRSRSRAGAMRQVDKPYRWGKASIENTTTGETWRRTCGSWVKQ